MKSAVVFSSFACVSLCLASLHAQPTVDAPSAAVEEKPAPPAEPYSLPFALRSAGPPANVVRIDTAYAPYSASDTQSGTAMVSLIGGSVRLGEAFALCGRVGVVDHVATDADTRQALTNPALGLVYGLKLAPRWRFSTYMNVALPFGAGGGDSPDKSTKAAMSAGSLARSAMDGALFATNDVNFVPGVDLAYTARGLTVQVEGTVAQLVRARGAAVQTDATRTNFLGGVHVGYRVASILTISTEARYQRWLSTPSAVEKDPSTRDNLTAALGVRTVVPLHGAMKASPGLSFALGLRGPVHDRGYHIVQLDVPITF